MAQTKILIIDPKAALRDSLRTLLKRNNFLVDEASSTQEALNHFTLNDFSLIFCDDSSDTLITSLAEKVPVFITAECPSLDAATRSIKNGAADYIAKPFNNNDLIDRINEALVTQNKTAKKQYQNKNNAPFCGMIGKSPAMMELFQRIQKVAATKASVLIQGESGVGKELVAKAIHSNSKRATGPLICVNCAAIPDTLIESELFGHEKGSFTGAMATRTGLIEAANGGTLFLDEIGELPLEAQARLLRVLQEQEIRRVGSIYSQKVDIRIITATHRNLYQLSSEAQFREDLYYRIKVVELRIPALRERGKDILILAKELLKQVCQRMEINDLSFSPEAMAMINQHQWPGNVRELEHAIERAAIFAEDTVIQPEDLDIQIPSQIMAITHNTREPKDGLTLEDYFQHFVLEHQHQMTETELAQKLGISRKTLWERRQRLGIPRKKPVPTQPAC